MDDLLPSMDKKRDNSLVTLLLMDEQSVRPGNPSEIFLVRSNIPHAEVVSYTLFLDTPRKRW